MKRTKRIGIVCLLALLCVGGLCGAVYRADRQQQRNRQLISLIKQHRAGHNDASAILACLKSGADPNARDKVYPSGLSWNRLLMLLHLRNAPAAPPAQSALLLAVEGDFKTTLGAAMPHYNWGDPDIVKTLLQYGADIKVKDRYGRTAFAAAFSPVPLNNHSFSVVLRSSRRCALLLLSAGADVEDRDERGHTAIMEYERFNEPVEDALKDALIRKGADVNAATKQGQTALMFRAMLGEESECRFLLDHGADVNRADSQGQTALICAAGQGQNALVETLLKRGANIDANREHGPTALIVAASGRHGAIVRTLLQHGATVDVKDRIGYTALTYAVECGDLTCVRLLLERGASVKVKDNNGKTLSQLARAWYGTRNAAMMHLLQAHGMRE